MNITLHTREMQQAVINYVKHRGFRIVNESQIHIEFTKSRGDNGVTANVSINENPLVETEEVEVNELEGDAHNQQSIFPPQAE